MCGIVGWVGHGDDSMPDARRALGRIAHRGPDAEGLWCSDRERVGLGSRRLAILDLSAEADQPMRRGNTIGVHNGEIYNFVELRAELERHDGDFRTSSDTEVLLAAYRVWGEGMLARLDGMFALAIWDPERREMLLARDRFGEKPLFLARAGTCVHFASELKALFAFQCVRRLIDETVLRDFLLTGRLPDGTDATFFAGVTQLRPATSLRLTPDGASTTREYWRLEPDPDAEGASLEQATERLGLMFEDSVRKRLRSDVPIGTSLSGGIDSTLVVRAVASQRLAGAPAQRTFSARHSAAEIDEGRHIAVVVAKTGSQAQMSWIEPREFMTDVEHLVWHQDEPFAHTSLYAQWKVYQAAARDGVTVMLDGQGADEIFGGYPSLAFGARWWSSFRRGRMLDGLQEIAAFRSIHHGGLALVLRYLGAAAIPPSLRDHVRVVRGRTGRLLAGGAASHPAMPHADCRSFRDPLKRELCDALRRRSLPSLLRYCDRSSMAHSVEVRLPFLDHRLVSYAFGLPVGALVDRGATKRVLRELLRPIPEIAGRHDKIGFATPELSWFRGPLREWMAELIRATARRGIYRRGAASSIWEDVLSGRTDPQVAWRLASVELWLRRFHDVAPEPPADLAAPRPPLRPVLSRA